MYITCTYLLWFYSRMGRRKRLCITSIDIHIDSEINDQSFELSATEGDQSGHPQTSEGGQSTTKEHNSTKRGQSATKGIKSITRPVAVPA
ncbi:unnamed protein product [Lactuca virosa]|uniref:Uncharacterized protein n=1 Tax=Lactuca virosa TaxID=75947 RepID=A0AAU9PX81_9ASTR|nr:unnamed protein product [Lactuca virosa]